MDCFALISATKREGTTSILPSLRGGGERSSCPPPISRIIEILVRRELNRIALSLVCHFSSNVKSALLFNHDVRLTENAIEMLGLHLHTEAIILPEFPFFYVKSRRFLKFLSLFFSFNKRHFSFPLDQMLIICQVCFYYSSLC